MHGRIPKQEVRGYFEKSRLWQEEEGVYRGPAADVGPEQLIVNLNGLLEKLCWEYGFGFIDTYAKITGQCQRHDHLYRRPTSQRQGPPDLAECISET
jgi:hypothetical protein